MVSRTSLHCFWIVLLILVGAVLVCCTIEEREKMGEAKIPLTVITGFLGAGKTTLLNHILNDPTHRKRIAVVENEFALEVGLERELVDVKDEGSIHEIFEFGNGCLCCSSRGEFERVLHSLCTDTSKYDYIIIESTGLADPIFIQSLFQEEINSHLFLDSIVVVVDTKHILLHLAKKDADQNMKNEAEEQLLYADVILLNKIDLVTDAELKEVEHVIKKINPTARLQKTLNSKVDVTTILDIQAFNLERITNKRPELQSKINSLSSPSLDFFTGGFGSDATPQTHNSQVTSALALKTGYLKESEFHSWLKDLLARSSQDIFRIKGVVAFEGRDEQMIVQGVHGIYNVQPHQKLKWKSDEEPTNKLAFIGNNLNSKQLSESFNKIGEK